MARKRLPRNADYLGTTATGECVYFTFDSIITKRQRKPPWYETIVFFLVQLYAISPDDYESYRRGDRELDEIFLDSRLWGYPACASLYQESRYRFKPIARYFEAADDRIRRGVVE